MQMTNAELAQAIEIANQRVRQCGTGQPLYEPLLDHLKALLAEQRKRATTAAPFAPTLPQPTFMPAAPPWGPWQPPYTVTCGGLKYDA